MTREEKIVKLKLLYEKATIAGEKQAALNAISRIQKSMNNEQNNAPNWFEDMRSFLLSKTFYLCATTGNHYTFAKPKSTERVELRVQDTKHGMWSYINVNNFKKVRKIETYKEGTRKEDLKKILS